MSFSADGYSGVVGAFLQHQFENKLAGCGWRFDLASGNLYYRPNTVDSVLLASGLNLQQAAPDWHVAKLVANPVSGKAYRLIFDSYTFDLSDQTVTVYSTSVASCLVWIASVAPASGVARQFWIDDVIVTQEEA